MYVCVCNAVTEKQIFKAAQAGARTLKELKHTLGVAKECGRCSQCAKQCLNEATLALGNEPVNRITFQKSAFTVA